MTSKVMVSKDVSSTLFLKKVTVRSKETKSCLSTNSTKTTLTFFFRFFTAKPKMTQTAIKLSKKKKMESPFLGTKTKAQST